MDKDCASNTSTSDVSQDSVIIIDVKKESPDPISVHLPMKTDIASWIREMEVFLFWVRPCSRLSNRILNTQIHTRLTADYVSDKEFYSILQATEDWRKKVLKSLSPQNEGLGLRRKRHLGLAWSKFDTREHRSLHYEKKGFMGVLMMAVCMKDYQQLGKK